jgi:hypothetical protein
MRAAGSRIAALFSAAGPRIAHSGTDGAWEREIESGLEAGYVRVGRYANQGCCPGPACGGACGMIRCRARLLYTVVSAAKSARPFGRGSFGIFAV